MVLFSSGGSRDDPEVVEVSSSSWAPSNRSKRKWSEVVPLDVFEMGSVDHSEVLILEESNTKKKNKQPILECPDNLHELINNGATQDVGSSTSLALSVNLHFDSPKFYDDEDYNYLVDGSDSSVDDYEQDDPGDIWEADAYDMAIAFENLDHPPGVESTVPLLQKPEHKKDIKKPKLTEQVVRKPMLFKQFDVVEDASDHYYHKGANGIVVKEPSKAWCKRIQRELKVLEKDLPELIFVRVYGERLDILRAVIVGPAGTPYHDGLFFFDVFFPSNYPSVPPLVHYHSGGLRLNPNLYNCGKVCLSLLGTWHGSGCERWDPSNSTMLQVLVSIQALVLNAKPYFNEPGYATLAGTQQGEKKSFSYNEKTFLLSCKTMLYTLWRPPRNFESFVLEHFQNQGQAILVACSAYMNGAQVGCVDAEGVQDVDEGDTSSSPSFRQSLKVLFDKLLLEFSVKGVDCSAFLGPKPIAGEPTCPDTSLKL